MARTTAERLDSVIEAIYQLTEEKVSSTAIEGVGVFTFHDLLRNNLKHRQDHPALIDRNETVLAIARCEQGRTVVGEINPVGGGADREGAGHPSFGECDRRNRPVRHVVGVQRAAIARQHKVFRSLTGGDAACDRPARDVDHPSASIKQELGEPVLEWSHKLEIRLFPGSNLAELAPSQARESTRRQRATDGWSLLASPTRWLTNRAATA